MTDTRSPVNLADYLFETSRHADTPFFSGPHESITCRELYRQVSERARVLQAMYGTRKQMLILADNGLFFILSYLSIMKSGNTAVLVETRVSRGDLEKILAECPVSCIFAENKFASKIPEGTVIHGPGRFPPDAPPPAPLEGEEIPGETIAAIIFTSGTTGTKKGVMLSHRNIIANTESIIQYLKLTVRDRICVVLPFFYCYGASLLHTHLRVGGSMVMANPIFLGAALRAIEEKGCTGLAGVPSTYQILINRTDFLDRELPSLRYFTQAGGKLENKYITRIADAFPGKEFYVMYGATEASARLSYLPPHLVREKLGSIGKGIPGITLEVLDEEGRPVRPGQVGEITAKGDSIMQGYYRDSDLTAAVLREGRLYTGDLATVDGDGFIYVVGRKNQLIKSAGYRVSPLEIEEVISSVPGVGVSVVLGIPDHLLGEAIIAVVQPDGQRMAGLEDEILGVCRSRLPSYKVPRRVVLVKDLPLNASNKIDREKVRGMVGSLKPRSIPG